MDLKLLLEVFSEAGFIIGIFVVLFLIGIAIEIAIDKVEYLITKKRISSNVKECIKQKKRERRKAKSIEQYAEWVALASMYEE